MSRAAAGAALADAVTLLGDRARTDHPLGALTTYRVGGRAAVFLAATSVDDLAAARGAVSQTGVPVLVLGKGSNMLVSDVGFPGLVVAVGEGAGRRGGAEGDPASSLLHIGVSGVTVTAGAGVDLPVLARRSAAAGVTGLEWAVGVPGSVGGGVRMNAGGHGSDMASCVVRWSFVDLAGGPDGERAAADLGYGYRSSTVASQHVVVSATFGLAAGDRATSEAEIADIVRWRRANQPGGQNAGSVFTNPPGDSAGRLIEACGLKGRRVGSAEVSTKHANFIQADAGGSADDVHHLIQLVRDEVARQAGVELRTEVRLVGFAPGEGEA